MSETNSLNNPNSLTDPSPSAATASAKTLEAAGHLFFERLGVGGMGEVYRCADDALQRDLAIKVLRTELRGDAAAEERFLREARLTGSLQHPGIVPVHQLGRLTDGRPCYTMKLVRGRTLAELLRDDPAGPERLPRLLAVVEKVCQAVAFAHSKGILHRDLKPSNVMVGEFGEVQVMDWGLAKQLSRPEPAPVLSEATAEVETVGRVEEAEGLSRAGAALGTPAYMPPEQAAGDWDIVDERADVFALGAILCELLTGRPPYHGANRDDLLRRARRGDVAEALGRLEQCEADTALVELCRECLAAERLERPRHAGVVAARLAAYQAQVQERLRRAEVERAETEVRVREERKRRRLTLALAVLVLVLLTGGGAAWWWRQQQLDKAERAVSNALVQVDVLAGQARENPLQPDKYQQALDAARVAGQLAESASAETQRQVQKQIELLKEQRAAARKDRELLAALLDVRGPQEGPKYHRVAKDTLMALAEPTADELFAAAFRRWGLDVDSTSIAEVAAQLKARPAAVVTEVSAALDEWASERRRGKAKDAWQRLVELAALLDDNPGSKRRELRQIMAQGRLPLERALDALSATLRPVPVPVEVPLGPHRARLRQLAEQTDAAHEPILGLLTLGRALQAAGEETRAEQLLRVAIVARPREVVLHHTLGQMLGSQQPPRWAEAVECFASARTLRPDLGMNLAMALRKSGRGDEGLALLARLVSETPANPYLHFELAGALHDKGRWDEAIDALRQTIALDPKFALAHNNLGVALRETGRLDEAMSEFRRALALDPKDAAAHTNLGSFLSEKGQLDEAVTEFRRALALDPKDAAAHSNLGNALSEKGQLDEAVAEYRQAIALDPKHALAHSNLGNALRVKGQLDEAVAECRQALALDPKNAAAHTNLGVALRAKGQSDEAMAEWHYALALDPKFAAPHTNLGIALHEKGRLDEAMAEYRHAIALDPKNAVAHYNLGIARKGKGQLDEAMAEYRHAIALNPKLAMAHGAMGQALLQLGHYAAARESSQRALELLSSDAPLRRLAMRQLQQCERLLALGQKLPAILKGAESPFNPGEAIALALICQQPHKKRYAAAARLYADAFAAEPKLTADLNAQHRYNAACSAALAAVGQGVETRLLPDKVAAMFRRWALGWLREELKTYAHLAKQNNPQLNQAIQQRLTHWQHDPDLTSVRDPQMLERLPDTERAAWQALWREVDELLSRGARSNEQKATQKKAQPDAQ